MFHHSQLPALTAAQMAEVDRVMIEDLHIELPQMMENAGRNLAELAIRRFAPGEVLVMVGRGGNGGGGLVAARHLHNRGTKVRVVLARADHELAPVPAHQLDIIKRMGVPVDPAPRPADLVIDALIGYSLQGDPRGRTAELIEWANHLGGDMLSLDAPSGLDVTTGQPGTPCITAAATLTLAMPKKGLLDAAEVGELYLADISVPPKVYTDMGLTLPNVFAGDTIVRIHRT